jgi:hypothetical protein
MGRAVAISIMTVALGAALASPSSARRHLPRCAHPAGSVRMADAQVIVYGRNEFLAPSGFEVTAMLVACSLRSGRRIVLGPELAEPAKERWPVEIGRIVIVGPMLAYFRDVEGGGSTVVVANLHTGHRVRNLPVGATLFHSRRLGLGPVWEIVLAPDGDVAWITDADASQGARQLHIADAAGARLVTNGPDIEPGSLALAGHTVYWTQGGSPRSTTMH